MNRHLKSIFQKGISNNSCDKYHETTYEIILSKSIKPLFLCFSKKCLVKKKKKEKGNVCETKFRILLVLHVCAPPDAGGYFLSSWGHSQHLSVCWVNRGNRVHLIPTSVAFILVGKKKVSAVSFNYLRMMKVQD